MSFIWINRSAQSLGYILISIVLNPLERWNCSAELQSQSPCNMN